MTSAKSLSNKAFDNFVRRFTVYSCRRNEDGIWVLRSKYGDIDPYSVDGKWLAFYCFHASPRKAAFLKRKCLEHGGFLTQDADSEFSIKFLAKDSNIIAPFLKIRKRRKLSTKAREKAIINLRKARTRLSEKNRIKQPKAPSESGKNADLREGLE